jgi:hypothetical protein
MLRIRSRAEFALLLGVAASAIGQPAPAVHQTATRSFCSNIVALSGAKVDCSHLTPAQAKALGNIPAVLKTALENQVYLEEILQKLNEISTTPPPVVCKDNANCGVSTGQTGGITAGQIVNQEPARWYDWDGDFHSRQGNTFFAMGVELSEFRQMVTFENNKDWKGLKESAEKAVSAYPGWPTPLFFLSYADYHLCEKDEALRNVRAFISQATLVDQFSDSYDQPLRLAQGDLTAMLGGKWLTYCQ